MGQTIKKDPQDDSFLASIQREGALDTPAPEQDEKDKAPDPSAPPADKKEGEDGKPEDTGDQKPEGEGEGDKKPDSKDGDDKKPDESNLPFHKHPRWIASQHELKELREFREKVSPLIDQLGKPKEADETDTAIPDWFTELFGDNQAAWKKYRTYDQGQRAQLRQEILNDLNAKSRQATEESKKYDKWVVDQLTSLDDYIAENKLPKFNKNELLKVALEYKPTDDDGNISFVKAYKILMAEKASEKKDPSSKPNPTDAKKRVADTTMGKDAPANQKKDFKTSHDLAGQSFRDLAQTES